MYLLRRTPVCLFCRSALLLVALSNVLIVPANAQSSNPSDIPPSAELIDNDGPVEKSIKETSTEVTLEKEAYERGVDWHSWAEKVAGAVWGPLIDDGTLLCGKSVVRWQITSDYHVHITSIKTPIPGGANALVAAIKAVDGNPILAFPRGSGKTVVERVAIVGRPAIMHPILPPIRVYP
jgi:hypothetical protein